MYIVWKTVPYSIVLMKHHVSRCVNIHSIRIYTTVGISYVTLTQNDMSLDTNTSNTHTRTYTQKNIIEKWSFTTSTLLFCHIVWVVTRFWYLLSHILGCDTFLFISIQYIQHKYRTNDLGHTVILVSRTAKFAHMNGHWKDYDSIFNCFNSEEPSVGLITMHVPLLLNKPLN